VRPHLGILVTPATLLSHQANDDAQSRIHHLIGPDENTTEQSADDDEPPDVEHRRAGPPLKVRPRPG